MTCKIVNKTNQDMSQLTNMAQDLYPYSKQRLGFDKPVMVELHSDPENASNMLGKTAYYDPSSYKIVVYTDNRHPKDILRSLSHELVHHAQNCRGEFDNHRSVGEGYAQANEHLREMEKEAYLEGNMILRDWEDRKKTSKEKTKVNEEKIRELARKVIERLAEEKEIKETSKTEPLEEENIEEEEVVEEAEETNEEVVEETEETNEEVVENKTADQRHNERLFETLVKKWTK